MKEKKTNRRSQQKYPALDPQYNLKTRLEQLDYDYIDQLPDTWTDPKTGKKYNPKQFLNDFTNEAIHADFKTNKKRIHKKKKIESEKNKDLKKLLVDLTEKIKELTLVLNNSNVSTTSKAKIKKTINKLKTQLKKQINGELSYINDFFKTDAERKNNSRNRCVLTRAKAQGKALGIDDLSVHYTANKNVEDNLIEQLDFAKKLQDSHDDSDDSA